MTKFSRQNPQINVIFDRACINPNDEVYYNHGQQFERKEFKTQQQAANRKSLHSTFKIPIKLRKSQKDLYPTLEQISQICEELMSSISKIQAISDQQKKLTPSEQHSLEKYLQTSQKVKQKPIKVIYPVPCDYIRSLTLINRNEIKHRISLKTISLIPNLHFEMKQIQPIKIVANPLSKFLTQKKVLENDLKRQNRFDTGFLTLDEEHRLLPLMENQQLTLKYPIVGVWVYNVPEVNQNGSENMKKSTSFDQIISHPLVWAACSRFIFCDQFQSKLSLSQNQNSFLLVCFHGPANPQTAMKSNSGKNLSPIFMQFKALNSTSGKNSNKFNKWMIIEHDEQSLREVNGFPGFDVRLNTQYSYTLQQYLELLKQKRNNILNITCNNQSEGEEEIELAQDDEDILQFESMQRSNSYQQSRRMSLNNQQQRAPSLKLVRMQSQKTLRSSSSSVLSGSGVANSKHSTKNFYKPTQQPSVHIHDQNQHQHPKQPPYSGGTSQLQINLSNFKQQHTNSTSSAFPTHPPPPQQSNRNYNQPRNFSPLRNGSFDGNYLPNNNPHDIMMRNSEQSNQQFQQPHPQWGYSPSNPVVNISSSSSMIPQSYGPPPFYNQQYRSDMDAMKVVSQQAASIKALQTQLAEMQNLFMQSAMWQPNGNTCFQSMQQQMMMNQFKDQFQNKVKKEMKNAETQTTPQYTNERNFLLNNTNMQNSFCQSMLNTCCQQNNIGQAFLPQNPLEISEIKSTLLANQEERQVKDGGNILTENSKILNQQNLEQRQNTFDQSRFNRSNIPSPNNQNQNTKKFLQRKLSVQELNTQSGNKNFATMERSDFHNHSPTELMESFSSQLSNPCQKKALSESGSKNYLQKLEEKTKKQEYNNYDDDDQDEDDDDDDLYKSMLKMPKVETKKKNILPPSIVSEKEKKFPHVFEMKKESKTYQERDTKEDSVSLSLKKEIKFPDKTKFSEHPQLNVSQFVSFDNLEQFQTMDMPIIIYKDEMDDSDQQEVGIDKIVNLMFQDDSCGPSQLNLIN